MAKVYDVVATTGTYQKDGETKYRNRNVGAIIETKHGFRLKIDASFNPAGCPRDDDGSVWLALFEPRPRDNEPQNAPGTHQPSPSYGGNSSPPAIDDDLDDIPW